MTLHQAAQLVAHANPDTARALHVVSLLRGRLEALEAALAGQDVRGRLRTTVRKLARSPSRWRDARWRGAWWRSIQRRLKLACDRPA